MSAANGETTQSIGKFRLAMVVRQGIAFT